MEQRPDIGYWIETATVYELLLLQKVAQSRIDELMENQKTLENYK